MITLARAASLSTQRNSQALQLKKQKLQLQKKLVDMGVAKEQG